MGDKSRAGRFDGSSRTPHSSIWREVGRNRAVLGPALILLLLCAAVVLGPLFLQYNFWETNLDLGAMPPSLVSGHYLGTDSLGRDLLARMLYGGRISLLVACVATSVSILIGVPYGAAAGFLGRWVDDVLMRIVDIFYSLPYMFLVIMLIAFFARPEVAGSLIRFLDLEPEGTVGTWLRGPGVRMVLLFAALGSVSWLTLARIVRGQVLSLKNMAFIEAARAAGMTQRRVIFRHLLPNALGVVIVYVTLTIPSVILQEAFLSFLGLGIQPPQASWGTLIYQGVQSMDNAWWLLVFPCLILALTLVSLNFLGDSLRDVIEPHD